MGMGLSLELTEKIADAEGTCSTRKVAQQFGVSHVTVWKIWKGYRPFTPRTIEERFFEHVEKTQSCWIWTGCIGDWGYGKFKVDGQVVSAHRVALTLIGIDVEGQVVRHSCDNPICVNPNHLSTGTHADNVGDRVSRGRSAVGTNHGRSKLDENQVLEIFKDTETPKATLARRFSVDPKVVANIQNHKTWKSVTAGRSR